MSWMKCHDCEHLVDTDADPDCWIEIGNMRRMTEDVAVCLSCRDAREMEDDRREDEASMAEEIDALCNSENEAERANYKRSDK